MKLSERLSLSQFLRYVFSGFIDRPLLRTIELIGILLVIVYGAYQQGAFWFYFLIATISVIVVALLSVVVYAIIVFSVSRSKGKGVRVTVNIDDKSIATSYGEVAAGAESKILIERSAVKETWFVGRIFYVKRKYITYAFVIPKAQLKEFKQYTESHNWNIRPSSWRLRYVLRIGVSVVVIALLLLIPSAPYEAGTSSPTEVAAVEQLPLSREEVFNEINRLRAEQSLPPLTEDATLNATALAFCKQMETEKFFDQVNPQTNKDGYELILEKYPESDVFQLLLTTNRDASTTLKDIVGTWQKDSASRDVIFSTSYPKVGVGICNYTVDTDYKYNVVVHFAS